MAFPKKKFVWGILLLATGIALTIFVATRPSGKSSNPTAVLKRSTGVPLSGIKLTGLLTYDWVSDDEILLLALPDAGFVRINVKTGQTNTDPILNTVLEKAERIRGWSISPDRKWLLTAYPKSGDSGRKLVKLETGEAVAVPSSSSRLVLTFWRPDSSGWIDTPLPGRSGELMRYLFDGRTISFTNVGIGVQKVPPIGFEAAGHFLFRSNANESAVSWLSMDSTSPAIARTTKITLPEGYSSGWTVCSPSGNRMVFVASEEGIMQYGFLSKPPYFRAKKIFPLSIWICGVEGDGLKCLGNLPHEFPFYGLRWSPDETRISFAAGKQIWITAID